MSGRSCVFGEHKACPTCQFHEVRMDAPYCSYCGGKHILVVYTQLNYGTISIPVVIDETIPADTFKMVSRKRQP